MDNGGTSDPSASDEALRQFVKRIWRWIENKSKNAGFDQWLMVVFTGVLTIVAVLQTILAFQNSSSSSKQIEQIINSADRIDDAADSFSSSAQHINEGVAQAVSKLDSQAQASHTSATATRRSVQIAQDTLHISQRAYIVEGPEQFDFSAKVVDIPILNVGRMPSGKGTVVIYEASIKKSDPLQPAGTVFEKHWRSSSFTSISANSPGIVAINIKHLDETSVKQGLQSVIVASVVTYDDGFKDDPKAVSEFCAISVFDPLSKGLRFADCPFGYDVEYLKKVIGYPQNEETFTTLK